MYHPILIANFFVKKGIDVGEPITQMKVQKLVYISHGWYMAATNRPLISSVVEAWKFGPVIPELYHALKAYGNEPITNLILIGSQSFQRILNEIRDIKDEDRQFLEKVWSIYGKFTAIYLSELTHQKDTPWDKVASSCDYELPMNKDIDNDLIKEHYYSLLTESNTA